MYMGTTTITGTTGTATRCRNCLRLTHPHVACCCAAVPLPRQESFDQGYGDQPRGWFDARCQGVNNDYCRWVGNRNFESYWSCALSGASDGYTAPGAYTYETMQSAPCTAPPSVVVGPICQGGAPVDVSCVNAGDTISVRTAFVGKLTTAGGCGPAALGACNADFDSNAGTWLPARALSAAQALCDGQRACSVAPGLGLATDFCRAGDNFPGYFGQPGYVRSIGEVTYTWLSYACGE
jgi:hypothetical protein